MLMMMPFIIFSALLNTAAQLLLKTGMEKIGAFNFTWSNVVPVALKIACNPFILIGLLVYVFSVSVWLLVLSRVPVSVAYPMSSLGYIFSAIAAYFVFGEHLSCPQVIGILIIVFGVYLIAQHQ